jgi:hypothetical protein
VRCVVRSRLAGAVVEEPGKDLPGGAGARLGAPAGRPAGRGDGYLGPVDQTAAGLVDPARRCLRSRWRRDIAAGIEASHKLKIR